MKYLKASLIVILTSVLSSERLKASKEGESHSEDDLEDFDFIETQSEQTPYDSSDSETTLESPNGSLKLIPNNRRKPYPTFVHCKGILPYCQGICKARTYKFCANWIYLCSKAIVDDIPRRCHVQCVHNYRLMKWKYPIPPKLERDVPKKFPHGQWDSAYDD